MPIYLQHRRCQTCVRGTRPPEFSRPHPTPAQLAGARSEISETVISYRTTLNSVLTILYQTSEYFSTSENLFAKPYTGTKIETVHR